MNGKQFVIWNAGIDTQPVPGLVSCHPPLVMIGMAQHGFYPFLVAVAVAAVSYGLMASTLSEMVSIVPFSGGCYGYVRCTLGPTLGFVTGIAEASKYVLFCVSTCYFLGEAFSVMYGFDKDTWLPVIWCGFFCLAFTIPLLGKRPIWWCWAIMALFALSIQLIFIAGSMKEGKIRNFLPLYNKDDISFENCVGVFAYASLLFLGVDDMRTCAHNHVSNISSQALFVADLSVVVFTDVVFSPMVLFRGP